MRNWGDLGFGDECFRCCFKSANNIGKNGKLNSNNNKNFHSVTDTKRMKSQARH